MPKPLIFICQGKTCSRANAHEAMLGSLCKVADVRLMRCQKICHGTVVALSLSGKLEWFERVNSPKLYFAVQRALLAGKRKNIAPSLKKRRLKNRSGRLVR